MSHGRNRHWPRTPDIESLLHTTVAAPTTSIAFISSGLDGDITGYREVTLPPLDKQQTALNSTSVQRAPGALQGFVRGKSGYYPFRPGGLEDIQVEDPTISITEGLENAFEKRGGESPGPT